MTLPCLSPSTWISMWRGLTMNFSMNMRSSPNEDFASERARAKPSATSAGGMGDAHALAAAASRGLDHHRKADLLGDLHWLASASSMTPRWPGTVETLALAAAFFELDLVAHRGDGFGIGPDEDDAGRLQRLGKCLALGKKAIARVHRLGAGRAAGLDDLVDDADSSAPPAAARSAPPRRPSRHAARRGRPRNRPQPSRSPCGARF